MTLIDTHGYTSGFVDREEELEVLARTLIREERRAAVIVGDRGVGKTALAYEFSRQFGAEFPGGIARVAAPLLEFVSHEAVAREVRGDIQCLVVIDDLDYLHDSAAIQYHVARVLGVVPAARLLLISDLLSVTTLPAWPDPVVVVALHGLSREATERLITSRLGAPLDPSASDRLHEICRGNPRFLAVAMNAIMHAGVTIDEALASLQPFSRPGVLGPDGRPLARDSRGYRRIVTDVTSVSGELLDQLLAEPDLVYELSPRRFEEVVAELLSRLGYDVDLTPASKDGGRDIHVATRNDLGSFLYLVECKRWAPDRPVGVQLVRQLYGVVQAEKATAGLLATTSSFTRGAKEFQQGVAFQISLRDYSGIQEWLRRTQR